MAHEVDLRGSQPADRAGSRRCRPALRVEIPGREDSGSHRGSSERGRSRSSASGRSGRLDGDRRGTTICRRTGLVDPAPVSGAAPGADTGSVRPLPESRQAHHQKGRRARGHRAQSRADRGALPEESGGRALGRRPRALAARGGGPRGRGARARPGGHPLGRHPDGWLLLGQFRGGLLIRGRHPAGRPGRVLRSGRRLVGNGPDHPGRARRPRREPWKRHSP